MKFVQQPGTLMMVRPAAFGFNAETSPSNVFQAFREGDVQKIALHEFDRVAAVLESHNIDVRIFNDDAPPAKPDAIFPNNWISFHHDGTAILYPLMAPNRRTERRAEIIDQLKKEFFVREIIDLTYEEHDGRFLEGTGSLVFDHVNKLAYASRSQRTDELLVRRVCGTLGYTPVLFNAYDEQGRPVYHTNVVLTVGEKFAVICLDAIPDEGDQERLLLHFEKTSHKVIAISFAQMRSFAGNMLEVATRDGEAFVLLSETAFASLLPGQINAITKFGEMLPLSIKTIETVGGGSVRCMLAGIHLPTQKSV